MNLPFASLTAVAIESVPSFNDIRAPATAAPLNGVADGAGECLALRQTNLDGARFRRPCSRTDLVSAHRPERLPILRRMRDDERAIVRRFRQRPAVDRNDRMRHRSRGIHDLAANAHAARRV